MLALFFCTSLFIHAPKEVAVSPRSDKDQSTMMINGQVCGLIALWPLGSNHQLRDGFCEGKKNNTDTMITPVTASETYLQQEEMINRNRW